MLPSLQSKRPKVQQPQQNTPLYQQQIRLQQTSRPSNQIEAMPPHKTPATLVKPHGNIAPMYNPATTHPVFFGAWKKAPFPLPVSGSFSPIAAGYVFDDSKRRSSSMTKL